MDNVNQGWSFPIHRKLLIQIIIEELFVNDKIEKIVFFKDVTFGILYESIKASENL